MLIRVTLNIGYYKFAQIVNKHPFVKFVLIDNHWKAFCNTLNSHSASIIQNHHQNFHHLFFTIGGAI
jgi:hypothetical protein